MQLALHIAVAAAAAGCRPAARAPKTTLSAAEVARAQAFIGPIHRPEGPDWHLRTSRWTAEFADIDHDGRADCWAFYTDDTMGFNLLVWPSCEGDRENPVGKFRNPSIGMAALAVPTTLSSPSWLMWLAQRLRPDTPIRCVGNAIPNCEAPGPEWRWVLATRDREPANPGLRGTVEADWQTTPRRALAGALIVADPHAWFGSRPGAWILLDEDLNRDAPGFECGGLRISVEDGGILATDNGRRWKWLFRGLPDYGGFFPGRLTSCVDGFVAAQSGPRDDFVVLDPKTGAWLFVSSRAYEGVHNLYDAMMRGARWHRNGSSIEPSDALRSLVVARPPR